MTTPSMKCPNCSSLIPDKSHAVCLKCGKRLKDINPQQQKTNFKKQMNLLKKRDQKSNRLFFSKIISKPLSFIFLIFTLFFAYSYLFNISFITSPLKQYLAPYSFSHFQKAYSTLHKIVLNKNKSELSFILAQLKIESTSPKNTHLYSPRLQVIKYELTDDNTLKLKIKLINASPFSISMNKKDFYFMTERGLHFLSDSKHKLKILPITLVPWGNTVLTFYFKGILKDTKKNNLLNGKIVFNNSKKYAMKKTKLVLK